MTTKTPSPSQSRLWFVTLLAAISIFLSLTGVAAEPWRQIGPAGAGSFDSMVADPQDPLTMYATSSFAGVYKSTDGGMSWEVLPQSPKLAGQIQIHSQATSTLYVRAGGTSDIFKSEDGGDSWVSIHPREDDPIYQDITLRNLTLDPISPQILFAQDDYSSDHPDWTSPGNDGGVSRSRDGGKTWQQVNAGLPQSEAGLLVEVTALAIDPLNPLLVYAGLMELRSRLEDPGQIPQKMLYRSVDGGDSWEKVSDFFWVIERIVIDPDDTAVIYVGAKNSRNVLHRSLDRGKSWRHFDPAGPNTIHVHVTGPSMLITQSGGSLQPELWKSVDRGDTWESFKPPVQFSSFYFDSDENILYAAAPGSGNGLYKSPDGGETWHQFSEGVHDKVIGQIKAGPEGTSSIYAIENRGNIYRSADGGNNWVPMTKFWPNSRQSQWVDFLAVDSVTAALYAIVQHSFYGFTDPKHVFMSLDEGDSWTEMAFDLGNSDPTSILIDPWDPSTLYMATTNQWDFETRLYRSFDGGESWEVSLEFIGGEGFMAPLMDPLNPSTMYVGNSFQNYSRDHDDSRFMKSTDSGDTWAVHAEGLPMEDRGRNDNSVFTIDAFNPENLVVATRQGIYKTTDGAQFWWRVDRNWPDEAVATDLLIDPVVSSTIYASSQSHGVLRSVDGGANWGSFSEGLTLESVFDLEIDEQTRVLYAATVGEGVFARPTVDAGMTEYAIFADPNPIRVCDGQTGSTKVVWRSPKHFPVKVRIGSMTGPLFAHTVRPRSKFTGHWAREGLQFYLLSGYSGEVLAQTTIRTTDSGCKPFSADPNPIQVCQGSVGKTTLSWLLSDRTRAEIRVGSPTGKLMGRVGPVGELQTGNWVRDGMQFFLLDQSTQAVIGEVQVSHSQDGC